MVKVTVFPPSPDCAVYVGFNAVEFEVIEPAPFSVHNIVPLAEVAPLTIAEALEQIVCEPPAVAVGKEVTVPLAATFCVVAPVDVLAIFPEGVPAAALVKRT